MKVNRQRSLSENAERKKQMAKDKAEAVKEGPKQETKTQTIYTHGKVFKNVPASINIDDFIKEKFPKG